MATATKRPCKQCPYLKNSAPGYLGDSSNNPELFLNQLETLVIHPCHVSVDWDIAEDEDILNAPVCVGALQFMNNSCKSSRFDNIRSLQREVGKNDSVFGFRPEFIEHHS